VSRYCTTDVAAMDWGEEIPATLRATTVLAVLTGVDAALLTE